MYFRIQAWSYWSHKKLRLKVIIVKGREGEWALVPAVPDNLFSLLHSNWSQECWWDQRLLIVYALSAAGWVFVSFYFIFILMGVRKAPCMQHACLPWHMLSILPLSLVPLTSAQSWNRCLLLLPSAPFLFRPYPCLPWPFLVTKIWSRVKPWLDAAHCMLMDENKNPLCSSDHVCMDKHLPSNSCPIAGSLS